MRQEISLISLLFNIVMDRIIQNRNVIRSYKRDKVEMPIICYIENAVIIGCFIPFTYMQNNTTWISLYRQTKSLIIAKEYIRYNACNEQNYNGTGDEFRYLGIELRANQEDFRMPVGCNMEKYLYGHRYKAEVMWTPHNDICRKNKKRYR